MEREISTFSEDEGKELTRAYRDYIRDIEIAEGELQKMKLWTDNNIADLYCVPSFGRQSYYVVMSEKEGKYLFTYVKPSLSLPFKDNHKQTDATFSICKEAESHLPFVGDFLIGIKLVQSELAEKLLSIFRAMPDRYIYDDVDAGAIYLDGYTQGIRYYGDGEIKTVLFRGPSKILGLTEDETAFLDSLYVTIGEIIQ